ncbi:MAG: toprim domain-containing protein [Paramuribaculum sp.]|nr:toprim domain-containing protein [Paramuribaculum sp.]
MNTRDEILAKTDGGLQVFKFYMPFEFRLKKNFKNPLYDDHNASCNIFLSQRYRVYFMKDFGNDSYSGDCFKFAAAMMGLDVNSDFRQVLNQIINDLHLPIQTESQYVRYVPTPMPPMPTPRPFKKPIVKRYDFIVKAWSHAELSFWQRYGITERVLSKYSVIPLSEYSTEGANGSYTLRSTFESPLFAYMGDGFLKLYRPFAEHQFRFQYGGYKPDNYIFGMKELPSQGPLVFITGGEKDVLSLASHGFNAICFNSETSAIPESTIKNLSNRFRHIVFMYDMDETGINAMEKAVNEFAEYGVMMLHLPLEGTKAEKDISDFFAIGHTARELQTLVSDQIRLLHTDTMRDIDNCRIDFNNPPEESMMVISAQGVPLGTYDNIMCVTGSAGTGKSNYVSALIAGALVTNPDVHKIDTLGYDVAPNIDRKAVILFDTEQSERQLYKNSIRILQRAGIDSPPDFFYPLHLTAKTRKDRLEFIKDVFDALHFEKHGIHLVVIDGGADLVKSVNDETECLALVDDLSKLAADYHTCIMCVVHLVPNGLKLRGHLGSELQRKAAGIITIEKEDNQELSVSKAIKVRDGNPLEVPMFTFTWDKEKDRYVSAGQKSEEDKGVSSFLVGICI